MNYIVSTIPFKSAFKNMLAGILPETINDNGTDTDFTVRVASDASDKAFLHLLTSNEFDDYTKHVDIDSTAYTLIYELGSCREIEYFYLSCYQGSGGNYAIGEVEIYCADTRDDLLTPKKRVAYIDNRDNAISKDVADSDFSLKIPVSAKGRFIAFKQLNTNSKDEISRITAFGAYSADYDFCSRYIANRYNDAFSISLKSANGVKSGNAEYLCDGIALDDVAAVKLDSGAKVDFSFKYRKTLSKIVIIGKTAGKITVVADKEYTEISPEVQTAEKDRNIYTYTVSAQNATDGISITFNTLADIDEVLAFSGFSEFVVNTDNVITEDFLGLGANVIPTHLFEGGRVEGFNDAYFELEKRRIAIAKPSVARVWFQIDWFVMDEDGYINRKYCFNSPKMQAVYKELDALKAADVEVEFNFGWKVGYSAQEWFSFPDVFIRRASAPRDLDHFATACSDCLKELIVNRGYDNIKYLALYNESNGGYPEGWDFLCPKGYDVIGYWKEMFLKVDAQLKRDGLRDKVKHWVAETGSTSPAVRLNDVAGEWLEYFNKNLGDAYEYGTFHQYGANYEEAKGNAIAAKKYACRPACVTEYAVYDTFEKIANGEYSFERNNIAAALGYTNGGISSMLFWILSGSLVDEGFWHNGAECAFWCSPVIKGKPTVDDIAVVFYQLSLITNYIPRHSKIVDITPFADGYHAVCAVTVDGNYTVAIESDNSVNDKNVRIKFPENVNKKFYKHEFTLDVKPEGNMIIPPVIAEFDVTDTLCDTLGCDYRFTVYTTIPPREQVVLDKCYVTAHAGEQIQLHAKNVDGNGKIKWSMCDTLATSGYRGSITEDGLYTADSTYYKDFTTAYGMNAVFAAKAESDSGEYAICIIEIKQ